MGAAGAASRRRSGNGVPSERNPGRRRKRRTTPSACCASDRTSRSSATFGLTATSVSATSRLSDLGGIDRRSSQQATSAITQTYAVRCASTSAPFRRPPQVPDAPGGICTDRAGGLCAAADMGDTASRRRTSARNKYNYWLPSLNLKFGLTNDLIFRLAASKDLARPALADIRNFLTIGLDANGITLTATAGNPYLKPIRSDNFDATLEWYFAGSRVGSLTFDAFYKNIHNYIYQARCTPRHHQQRRHREFLLFAARRTSAARARSRASSSPTRRPTTSCQVC